jgi:hypothetical protein
MTPVNSSEADRKVVVINKRQHPSQPEYQSTPLVAQTHLGNISQSLAFPTSILTEKYR